MREPIRNVGGNVDVSLEIDRLSAFRRRAAGTDAERRAARHLAARLERLGRDAQIEPTRVYPAFAFAHVAHALLGVVGSVLGVYVPVAGVAVVLLAAGSAFGDLTASFFLARRLRGIRASQNVVSDELDDKPGRLIVIARYDSGRTGALFGRRLRRWASVLFWSLLVILACSTARLLGLDATWLTIVQFVPTVALIALLPLFGEIAVAEPDDQATGNAPAAGAALRLAERYGGSLEHFDLTVLLTGADYPTPLGTRAWLRRHRDELEPQMTAVVCIEDDGESVYAAKEGLLFPSRHHPALVSICEDMETAEPIVPRGASGADAARSARLPAIRVSASYSLVSELVERIDERIGPELRT